MSAELEVAVVGATGAVGKEVLDLLSRTRWRPARVVAAASPATSTPFVEYGDESVPVEDAALLDLPALDVVILAAPAEVSREVGERAVEEGVLVVDVSGAFGAEPDVPTIVPWINPEALASAGLRGVVSLPGAPAMLLGSVLGPLARAGIVGEAHATVFVPASAWGRKGIEELSRQVVTLFNAGTPPRRVFPHGLAFDLIPIVGEPDAEGWSDAEKRVVTEVHRLLGAEVPLTVTLVAVPVFSGISADLTITLGRQVMPEVVARILEDGGARLPEEPGPRHLPRPRRVEGQPFVQVGRVRTAREGTRLHMWLSLDNLRAAAAAAVGLAGALGRERTG